MLIANLSAKDDTPVDINDRPERGGIASARGPFDHLLLIDSGLLTHDEIDNLRSRVYEELAGGAQDDEYDDVQAPPPVRFVKAHDAYTLTPLGEPLLAGARGAAGAVQAIAFMGNPAAGFCVQTNRQHNQLRQQLPGWSGHIASWLDQTDIPVH
jgi:aryl sulfotransferase